MARFGFALVVALGLALPGTAIAKDAVPVKKTATPLREARPADDVKLVPLHRMPARYSKDRRHFSRDVDPRTRMLLSVHTLPLP